MTGDEAPRPRRSGSAPDGPGTALVTGASAGIGADIARDLAARGWNLVLTARRRERLEALAAELRDRHGDALSIRIEPADLADPTAPDALFEALTADGIAVDLLVNNAGHGVRAPFTETSWTTQDEFLRVLLVSVVHLTHRFVGPMKERGRGRILNISSMAAFLPERPGDVYGPMKTFVTRFSRAVGLELAGTGVTVTTSCPGFTYTEFHDVLGTRDQVRRMPKYLWLKSERVAREAVEATLAGKAMVIHGLQYKLIYAVTRVVPSAWVVLLGPKGALAKRD
jgi:hypothetical protein